MSPVIKRQVTTPNNAEIKKENKALPFSGCHLWAQPWAVSGDELMHDNVLLWEPAPHADSWDFFSDALTTACCPAALSSM